MSTDTPQGDPVENGQDSGSGDQGDERAYMMNQPPADLENLPGGDGSDDDDVSDEDGGSADLDDVPEQ